MAKNLSIKIPTASRFFSPETIQQAEEEDSAEATPAVEPAVSESSPAVGSETSDSTDPPKNKGGRPKLEKKKKQYTLTMDPDLYIALKDKAAEKQTSFSQLVTNVMLNFLEND